MRYVLILLMLAAPAAAERRCGWLDNPSPSNYALSDEDGEWTIMTQGDATDNGFFDLPATQFSFGREWVNRNVGSYGYGCACLDGEFGPVGSGEVLHVTKMTPLPLAKCESDRALPGR